MKKIINFNSERNSAIEILRIIALLMIFFHHSVLHGGASFWGTHDFQDLVRETLYHSGKLGVVLISGYCLTSSKFRWKKLINLFLEIVFFTFLTYICGLFYNKTSFDPQELKKILLPFSSYEYWFMSGYLLLFLLSPFINFGLDKLRKIDHLIFIIIGLLLCSIIPYFYKYSTYTTTIIYFVVIFLIGAFFKRYPLIDLKIWKFVILVLSIALFIFLNYLIVKNADNAETKKNINRLFYDTYNPLAILIGTGIFTFFTQLKPFSSKVINFIAYPMLEVYLVHDSNYIRPFIYKLVFETKTIPHSSTWALKFIGINFVKFLAVFVIALLLKIIYALTIGNMINFVSRKIEPKENQ